MAAFLGTKMLVAYMNDWVTFLAGNVGYVFREEKGENVKNFVKFRNFELMYKRRSSEILADEKTYFWEKSQGKECRLRNVS